MFIVQYVSISDKILRFRLNFHQKFALLTGDTYRTLIACNALQNFQFPATSSSDTRLSGSDS